MNQKISIATPKDIPALNTLVNSAYRGEESKKGWDTEADLLDGTRTDEDVLREIMSRSDTTILKYEEDGKLVGCVELRKEGSRLYLGMLSVKPDLQGGGIGKRLMEASEAIGREQHCHTVFMTVISVRRKLIGWYLRSGYSLTGERKPFAFPDARWGIPKQELEFVVLEKKL
jgi:ribosomal protein S18 acetylase RimI-like enzyme